MNKESKLNSQLAKKLAISFCVLAVLFVLTLEWIYVRKYHKEQEKSQFWAHRYWIQLDSTAYYHHKYDSTVDANFHLVPLDHSEIKSAGDNNDIHVNQVNGDVLIGSSKE